MTDSNLKNATRFASSQGYEHAASKSPLTRRIRFCYVRHGVVSWAVGNDPAGNPTVE